MSRASGRQIDVALQAAVANDVVPGVVALATNATEVIYEGAAGVRKVGEDGALDIDSVFQIMSMTKPITSVATMMLSERAVLNLDDPITDYLSKYRELMVLESWDPDTDTLVTRPPNAPATIRQLLANTAGMVYPFCSPLMFSIQQARGDLGTRFPLLHDPGAGFAYSYATRVLGELITTVTGMSFDVFFREHMFEPLGMRDTAYDYEGKETRLAHPHRWGFRGLEPFSPFPVMVAGDGGLYSTARDYARFLRCLLAGGEPLLRAETFAAMLQNELGATATGVVGLQPEGNPGMTRPFPNNAGHDTFGLGFQLDAVGRPGLRAVGSFSWSGLLNTHFWGDPTNGLGGVILMQVLPFYDERCMALAETFEREVYRF